VTEEELNSEVELLKDDDVLRHVVEATDLASHDWFALGFAPTRSQRLACNVRAKRLGNRLNVESIKKTNLIGGEL